ncbi:hypothetical protein Sru01_24210 [Sphaerisporangium rufum]|uniref:VCBS repeat-containing protein n=1 Tax=Sphaerisporangium rufum TaxID=1381558 RepID=A0A919R0B6_9ACTN|nr:FG-GAP and VCBS repeat-containing protein [Sphaerisporangium rufum]GII77439.1 hypothetical protein Sru01_24210 [Sphaerisporangium rufum]
MIPAFSGRAASVLLVVLVAACAGPPPAAPAWTGPAAGCPSSAVRPPPVPVAAGDVRGHDYDGDGRADLAAGLPGAGRVEIRYGSANGIAAGRRQVVTGPGGRFGRATATGDLDGDGRADLVVAGSGRTAGLTVVLGGRGGLSDRQVTLPAVPGGPAGHALATGDFDRDGDDDLAVTGAGATVWVAGGGAGVRAGRATWRPVLRRGAAVAVGPLAAGDVTGDGFADLAVTYSADDPADEGTGVVYRGSPAGPAGRIRGTFPGWDVADVAIADLDGDGHGDVVAGIPWGHSGDPAGRVTVSRGSPGGLRPAEPIGPGSAGMPAGPPGVGRFGAALATGDLDADGYADVAVGAPDTPGAVYVLRGGPGGLAACRARALDAMAARLPGASTGGFAVDLAFTGEGATAGLAVTSLTTTASGLAAGLTLLTAGEPIRSTEIAAEHLPARDGEVGFVLDRPGR